MIGGSTSGCGFSGSLIGAEMSGCGLLEAVIGGKTVKRYHKMSGCGCSGVELCDWVLEMSGCGCSARGLCDWVLK